jgi:hypothetical protein
MSIPLLFPAMLHRPSLLKTYLLTFFEEQKMRKLVTICVVVSVLIAAAPAMATYVVDLGAPDVLSDAGITLSEWGEAEAGGGGGGRAEGIYGDIGVGNCRMVWGIPGSDDTDWAEITFPTAISSATIWHLNGSQYDSFNVYVDTVFWGSYTGLDGPEDWQVHTFSGTPGKALVIDITSNDPVWRDTWGQLAIDRVEAVPEPATICLLGLGALSLIRRKR